MRSFPLSLGVGLGIGVLVACSSAERSSFDNAASGTDPGPDASGVTSLGEAGPTTIAVTIKGTVYAPNGQLPMSNALVYLASEAPAAIPQGAFCDACVTLPDHTFAVSAADGHFEINANVPKGKYFIVVQKGQFRRVRNIEVKEAGDLDVAKVDTTLPGSMASANGDDIPKMVVLKDDADYDAINTSLNKLGITQFEIRNDRSLLENEAELMKYHIVFIPCGSSDDSELTSLAANENLQKFVAAGGKLYVTDWSYEFVRQPFQGQLSWEGETATIGSAASGDEWDAPATAADQGLADWLAATGDSSFSVQGNWTTISSLNTISSTDRNGAQVDVTPKVWVNATKDNAIVPTTVSFERQCGRVLFSTYHTDGDFGAGSGALTAQEKALLYVLLEVGVCIGDRPGVQ